MSNLNENLVGEQNKFYFKESKISKFIPKSSSSYDDVYNKIPVALILGWAGGIDKHIQKYEEIYSKLGYHTIRFSPSNKLTFYEYKTHTKYAYELLNLLKTNYKLTHNPIVTHFFSNASLFIIYQHIINELKKSPQSEYTFFKENHKALIFDSSPGLMTDFSTLYSGINDLVRQEINIFPITNAISLGFLALGYGYVKLWPKNYFSEMFNIVANDTRLVPSLYLYSKVDKLISDKSIKENIDKRRSKYPDLYVKEVVYNDSEHVLLFQKHPEDYLNHLIEHLKICKIDMQSILGIDYEQKIKSKL